MTSAYFVPILQQILIRIRSDPLLILIACVYFRIDGYEGERLVWLIGAVVRLNAAPLV